MAVRSTERTRPRSGREHRLEPYLFVALEGARLDAGGLRVALRGVASLRIGRGDTRALLHADSAAPELEIPDSRISSTHACIIQDGRQLVLADDGSTNGTLVNGARITRHALRDGDIVDLGRTVLLYRELEEPAGGGARSLDSSTIGGLDPGFTTLDPNLARQLQRLSLVARSQLPILILGETGSGKEMLAQALHAQSQRPGPFVPVNCGAIPQSLLESHLFGHVRGAFSGASRDEAGFVRAAHGGTLLLDEIGDLPLSSQTALLRVLQEREVRPVGSTQATKVDIRVLAATHMPLEELVARGAFRRDLYARLAGYPFVMPPLRERRTDLGLLVAALLSAGKLGPRRDLCIHGEAARALVRHDWPMNVRELEQCLHAAFVLAEGDMITIEDLPPALQVATPCEPAARSGPRDADARARFVALFAEHNGNVSALGRALRTSRSHVHRLMTRYKIAGKQ